MTQRHALPPPDPEWALFLDVDGTLIEIAETPDGVSVGSDLPTLLDRLRSALGGALALVSGRALRDLDRLFGLLHLPAAGLHGLERRGATGAIARRSAPAADLKTIRTALHGFAAAHPGVIVEDKTLSVALHYRLAPAVESEARQLVDRLVPTSGGSLCIQEGKMVLEIKPKGPNKGDVIRSFMNEPPFIGRIPVFVGDDITDEDGFAAVNALGGHSIRIGNDRPTQAGWQIDSVDALRAWLERLSVSIASEGAR